MKKLVLVNHWSAGIGNNKPPLGLGYLSAYLKKYLDFHDIAIVNTGKLTLEKILEHQPEIVGFTVYTAGYYDVLRLMKQLRQEVPVTILAGGPHITCLPHRLPPEVDIGFIGEGEHSLLEVMQLYSEEGYFDPSDLERIDGLAFWNEGKLQFSKPRGFITPLDRIPMPDRELLDIRRFLKPSQILMNNEYLRGATMLTSRGCPYHCIYCHVSAKWGKPRYHSPGYVVNEIDHLVNQYSVEGIYISDDLFAGNVHRIEAITKGMEQRKLLGKVRFMADLRSNMVNDRLVKSLKEMGVVKVPLGLESGSERILQYLKGKDVTVAQNLQAVKTLNKHGIGAYCCFMIGAPPETIEDIHKTRELIRKILDMDTKNFCQVTVTTPLPGTELWNYALKKGALTEDAVDWRQFSLNPLRISRPDFYINEHIDFEEFQKIARETFSLCNSRRLKSILVNFSWRYVQRALGNPKLGLTILRDYLKNR